MNSDRLIEEIKSRVDIVEFISDYVQLKKAGQNYKGLCPFHPEKIPSFMVSPSKQIFHCFGCGSGGDVISFLMKYDHLSFSEAKRYIAKKAGIQLKEPQWNKTASEKREKLFQIHIEALEFFKRHLKSSDSASNYLRKRGVDDVSIQRFCIGYAPNKEAALFQHLKEQGYTDSSIKDAGLVVSDQAGYRDTFRGRIILPIFNMRGDIIAFGGRVMSNILPKYLNSPETDIFKKGETLFAVNLSKEEIRKKGHAIVVEGYLDTIICHQYGFQNTVSPLGTALTTGQLHKLKVLTDKVIVIFDGDEAGISAARRSLAVHCESDIRARILLLPQGEDPDSFLRKKGRQAFQKLLSDTMSMIEFLMKISSKDKIDTVREALSIIAAGKDPIMADEMVRESADKSGISESVLRGELRRMKKKKRLNRHEEETVPVKAVKNVEEYLLLSAVISSPEKAEEVISKLNTEELREVPIKSLFEKIKVLGAKFDIHLLVNEATEEEKSIIRELSLKPGFDLEHLDQNIQDCLFRLAQRRLDERRNLIMAQKPDDAALHNSILKEKRKLIRESQL